MIYYYLKLSFRHLFKNKAFALINIFGLALGFTCLSAILVYVEFERSFDSFHPNSDAIHRVVKDFVFQDGTRIPDATTPPALSSAIRTELPEVAAVTRLFPNRGRLFLLQSGEKRFYETEVFRVDKHFFEVFDFPLLKGDKEKALQDLHSILLTESTAKKYFGDEEPLGKTIRINLNGGTDYVVTAVLKDLPQNSHFTFDVLFPFESRRDPDLNWDFSGFYTYALLKPGADSRRFESNVDALYKKNQPNSLDDYYIQPLTSVHLHSHLKSELGQNGDALYLEILLIIGVFIIVIAAVNYVNLTTAQSAKRIKEVGIRKMTGAFRRTLIGQFMVESLIVVATSLVLSIALLDSLASSSGNILSYDLSPFLYESSYLRWIVPGIAVLVWLLAGLYPAFHIASFEPLKVIRGGFLRSSEGINLRRTLVVFQFVISSALIIGSIVVNQQLDFIQNKKLGFNKDNVILLPNVRGGIGTETNNPGSKIEEMKKLPEVLRIGRADGVLGFNNSMNGVSSKTGNRLSLNFIRADYDFIPALEIELKEGRNFSPDFISDSTAIIINEKAAEQLGLQKPYINEELDWDDASGKTHKVHVVGVVSDFHFNSMREEIKPFGFILEVGNGSTFFLKVESKNISKTLSSLEAIWNKFSPEMPFDYSFQDAQTAQLHLAELRFNKLFSSFTVVAILIACLGLFGLISFVAENKTREIGIRKVLGASVYSIMLMLSKEFMIILMFSLLVASPLAYIFMNNWLDQFAYHIGITWKVFAFAFLSSIIMVWITIGFRSVRSAVTNPVDSLRNE